MAWSFLLFGQKFSNYLSLWLMLSRSFQQNVAPGLLVGLLVVAFKWNMAGIVLKKVGRIFFISDSTYNSRYKWYNYLTEFIDMIKSYICI